jgi:hypothetical protein
MMDTINHQKSIGARWGGKIWKVYVLPV